MAQTENGVGVSYKLPDGTMVWVRRDDWAMLREDVRTIFGEDSLAALEGKIKGAWANSRVAPAVSTAPPPSAPAPQPVAAAAEGTLSAEEAEALLNEPMAQPAAVGTHTVCPRCGALKDKWVPAGVSSKTGKSYRGFFACPTRGCPGR